MKLPALAPLLGFLALVSFSGFAQETPNDKPGLGLVEGDTIVFLGDSITHQALYTQYLEDFFFTRYPDRKLHFHNAGVAGDKAADALARFDEDVASLEPKVVTVLLGMNDGGYEDFGAETFERYSEDMTTLLDRIEAIGARPVVMSPTMFDHHQLARRKTDPTFRFRSKEFSGQYNALLAFFGGWLRERAGERGFLFVDQWAPMNRHTFAQRRTEPDFTLAPDAIHPAPAGHFLMAFELLWQIEPERRKVSGIAITPRGAQWRGSAEVSDLVVSEDRDRATFTHTATALPWVVPERAWAGEKKWEAEPGARLGYELTAAGHKLSNERLKIAGLAPGTYEVKIDGVSVGEFSHLALGSKVELQANEKTPQYQQALAMAELNRQRNDEAIRPLRDLWSRIKGLRQKSAAAQEQGNPETFPTALEELQPRLEELQESGREFEERIYELAQPKPRKYEVLRRESAATP